MVSVPAVNRRKRGFGTLTDLPGPEPERRKIKAARMRGLCRLLKVGGDPTFDMRTVVRLNQNN